MSQPRLKRQNLVQALGLGLALAVLPALAAPAWSDEAIVTNQNGDSLSIVDLKTMTVAETVKLSGKPAGIAISTDGKRAYVAAPEGKAVIAVDLAKRAVEKTRNVGEGPVGIAVNPVRSELYVADWYTQKITVLSTPALDLLAEIPVGKSPSGLDVTADGTTLVSADRDSDQVSIIDIVTRKVVRTVATGHRPFGVTVGPDGKRAFTANVQTNDVTVIDLAKGEVVATIPVGRRPYAIAFAGRQGYVTDQYAGTVTAISADTLKAVKSTDVCDHPEGIAIAGGSDGKKTVIVACWGDDTLVEIDPVTLDILRKVAVGAGPRAFGRFVRPAAP